VVHWSLPLTSLVKTNIGASFSLAQRKGCSRVIIRDEPGQIMGACSCLTFQLPIAFVAKALAVVHGLRFALEMGFLSVILESDSRLVIQKLTASSKDLSEISALIWEAKEFSNLFVDYRQEALIWGIYRYLYFPNFSPL
ncbi:hypothetical protein Goshw_012301, partial [Gossypium schwendimanii]|nr:hypothetical protein [Gossypium schwendimanii]